MVEYLKAKSDNELVEICQVIVDEFRGSIEGDRKSKSIFIFLERVFASSIFEQVLKNPENSFAVEVYNLLRNEVTKTRDHEKLTVSIEIFCQLLQVKKSIDFFF